MKLARKRKTDAEVFTGTLVCAVPGPAPLNGKSSLAPCGRDARNTTAKDRMKKERGRIVVSIPSSVDRKPLPHRRQILLSRFSDGDEFPLRL